VVPVVVTDPEGHHMTGLTEGDFQVFEDGVEQKIAAFSSNVVGTAGPTTGANPDRADFGEPSIVASEPQKPAPTRHTFVICLDMMHIAFASFAHVREALLKLFQQEQVGDSKYVLIALGGNLEVIADATSDPARILEAVNGRSFRNLYMRGQNSQSQFEISAYEQELQLAVQRRCENAEACQAQAGAWEHRAEELTKRERVRTTEFLAQFRSVVEQLGRDNGRRTMILISDGILLAPGEIPYGLLQAYFPGYRTTRSLENLHNLMEPVLQLAAKANVSIYTIDSRGLYGSGEANAARNLAVPVMNEVNREWGSIATDEGLALSEIATATGGRVFQNSNDLLDGLQRAFADGREYYTLAYVSTNEAQDGKFRKIKVKVRDRQAVVNAKLGYWANAQ